MCFSCREGIQFLVFKRHLFTVIVLPLSLQCGHESARTDIYLDIPLVIRPFGSSTSYSSVEQALSAFVEPEILDGNNQYFCEQCGKKCNAHKVAISRKCFIILSVNCYLFILNSISKLAYCFGFALVLDISWT